MTRNRDLLAVKTPHAGNRTTTGIAISFDTWSGNAVARRARAHIEGIIVRVDNTTVPDGRLCRSITGRARMRPACRPGAGCCLLGNWHPHSTDGDTRTPAAWAGLCWQPFSVDLAADGKLTVKWKGATILTNSRRPSSRHVAAWCWRAARVEPTSIPILTTSGLPRRLEQGEVPSLPPTVPANVRASAVGARRVVLAWDASTERPDPTGKVAYKVGKDGQLLPSLLTVTTYEDRTVNPATQHTYRVLATDVFGNDSALSSAVNVTTVAEVAGPAYLLGKSTTGSEARRWTKPV